MAIEVQAVADQSVINSLPPGDWPPQGVWTVEDWERLPDDGNRYEVIDGVLYITTAPVPEHQWVVSELHYLLRHHIKAQSEPPGILFVSPIGVILPTGPVIPDLVYFKMERIGMLSKKRINGVPDILVEVASPGTVGKDRREKQNAYARSGVIEYWLVDPYSRSVEVLTLRNGVYERLGLVSGQATVPSHILSGLTFPVDSIFMPPQLVAGLWAE